MDDEYFGFQYSLLQSLSDVLTQSFKQKNMVFSANDCILVTALRQAKG